MSAAFRVYFDTTPYRTSHLRKPRGRGTWAFRVWSWRRPETEEILWSPSATYGEAKRWARSLAAERFAEGQGSVTLEVLP